MRTQYCPQKYLVYTGDRCNESRPLTHFMGAHAKHFAHVVYLCYENTPGEKPFPAEGFSIRTVEGFNRGVTGLFRSLFSRRLSASVKRVLKDYPEPVVVWAQPSPFALAILKPLVHGSRMVIPFVRGDVRKNIEHNRPVLGCLGAGVVAECVLRAVVRRHPVVMVAGSRLAEKYRGTEKTHVWRGTTHSGIEQRADTGSWRGRVLFVGRLDDNKRCEDLIRAVAVAVEAGLELSLTVVGEGHRRRELEVLVRALGLERKVFFAGEVVGDEAIYDWYRWADVIAVTSLSEGTPKVVPESMSVGCLVIATPVGDLPFSLQNGECIFVRFQSPPDVADAIRRLSDDRALRNVMREAGYAYAQRNTLQAQVDELWRSVSEYLEPKEAKKG